LSKKHVSKYSLSSQIIIFLLAIPAEYQQLTFQGAILQDAATIKKCKIERDCTVQLLTREVNKTCDNTSNISTEFRLLHGFCIRGIVTDFTQECKQPEFKKLREKNLFKILSSNQLKIDDEMALLSSICGWVEAQNGRSRHASELLKYVRFPLIEAEKLFAITTTHPSISSCNAFQEQLQNALILQVARYKEKTLGDATTQDRQSVKYESIPPIDINFFSSLVAKFFTAIHKK